MSYRDDHDAALARATALAAELERERAAGDEHREQVARLERDLAAERDKLATAKARLAELEPPVAEPPAPAPAPAPRALTLGPIAAAISMVGLIGFCVAGRRSRDAHPPASGPNQVGFSDGLARARAVVNRAHPGSRLTAISAFWVDARGVIDLDAGPAHYDFVRPRGDPADNLCTSFVQLTGARSTLSPGIGCPREPEVLTPRCTIEQVWSRAFEQGASRNSAALIDLRIAPDFNVGTLAPPTPPAPMWFLKLHSPGEATFSFPDDC